MSEECETETVRVQYFIDAEFDDQAVAGTFGPLRSREAADSAFVALAGRTDCKKATLRTEVI